MLENEFDAYKWFFANGLLLNNTLSRGVAVGIRKNSPFNAGESKIVSDGNALKVNFKFEGYEFAFFGIYGPSQGDKHTCRNTRISGSGLLVKICSDVA